MRLRGVVAHEEGFTLVELIIYVLLLALVLAVVAGLFLSLYRTQNSVEAVTNATTNGQSANNSIQAGIRNSTAFVLTGNGTDQLLVARTLGTGSAVSNGCQAWYYSAGDHSIRSTLLSAPLSAVPAESTASAWTLLAGDVEPIAGTTVFSRASASDPTLTLAFSSAAGTGPRIQFSSSVASRIAGTDVSACYSGN